VRRSGFVGLWLPVVLWAAVIFALSSMPSLDSGLGTWDRVLRAGAHVAEYAILGALLARALGRRAATAVVAGVAYAVSDELHQGLVAGRDGSPVDLALDTLGVAAGVVGYRRTRT
jgi:VanZ family protein